MPRLSAIRGSLEHVVLVVHAFQHAGVQGPVPAEGDSVDAMAKSPHRLDAKPLVGYGPQTLSKSVQFQSKGGLLQQP